MPKNPTPATVDDASTISPMKAVATVVATVGLAVVTGVVVHVVTKRMDQQD